MPAIRAMPYGSMLESHALCIKCSASFDYGRWWEGIACHLLPVVPVVKELVDGPSVHLDDDRARIRPQLRQVGMTKGDKVRPIRRVIAI